MIAKTNGMIAEDMIQNDCSLVERRTYRRTHKGAKLYSGACTNTGYSSVAAHARTIRDQRFGGAARRCEKLIFYVMFIMYSRSGLSIAALPSLGHVHDYTIPLHTSPPRSTLKRFTLPRCTKTNLRIPNEFASLCRALHSVLRQTILAFSLASSGDKPSRRAWFLVRL